MSQALRADCIGHGGPSPARIGSGEHSRQERRRHGDEAPRHPYTMSLVFAGKPATPMRLSCSLTGHHSRLGKWPAGKQMTEEANAVTDVEALVRVALTGRHADWRRSAVKEVVEEGHCV